MNFNLYFKTKYLDFISLFIFKKGKDTWKQNWENLILNYITDNISYSVSWICILYHCVHNLSRFNY